LLTPTVWGGQRRHDPVRLFAELPQLDAAPDRRAKRGEVRREDPLGLVLGQAEELIRYLGDVGQPDLRLLTVDEHSLAPEPDAGVDHRPGDADTLPDLQGARLHADGLAGVGSLGELVDDLAAYAVAPQLARQHQADRPRADDQNVRVRCHLSLPRAMHAS